MSGQDGSGLDEEMREELEGTLNLLALLAQKYKY